MYLADIRIISLRTTLVEDPFLFPLFYSLRIDIEFRTAQAILLLLLRWWIYKKSRYPFVDFMFATNV